MCDQTGPQNKEAMSLEKLDLGLQGKATQVPRCPDRHRNGLNKSECLHMQVHLFFWGEIE